MPPKKRKGRPGPTAPTPFPWDQGPRAKQRIEANFRTVRAAVGQAALEACRPTESAVRSWHTASLRGVALAEPAVAGGFRGEGPAGSQLADALALIFLATGELPQRVAPRVAETFATLVVRLDALDARLVEGEDYADIYPAVIELCAWLHGEWVRIHPFIDHNGSTARLLTMNVGLLYNVPLNLPGKPRSAMPQPGLELDYGNAAQAQMYGNDHAMVAFLHRIASVS